MDNDKRQYDLNYLKYKGFDSFYTEIDENGWNLKNCGYDYGKTLMEDNVSSYLTKNSFISSMFPYLNKILTHLIDSVKYLRNFNNYGVRKDYKKIN